MPNHLVGSTSPYLLQHQNNPVDWYPWGTEALEKAAREDKPIFLSIGYSACHWCHVMEHESFEDSRIADLLNRHFISIKVDREQRPDLDQIYMQAVQMMTGSGGWPMSVFLTPEMKPFYGGTYWPPSARWGRPGFDQILMAVADAWKNRREELEGQGTEMVSHLCETMETAANESHPDDLQPAILHQADEWLKRSFEPKYGGFGGAPKFPHAMDLALLMRLQSTRPTPERLQIITHTLDSMANGGMYDHLGGGFARYSVDDRWLVPHFEKMLYDNALLIGAYLDGFLLTGNARYRTVLEETIGYLLRDMQDPVGGFYSAEDADSEGVEGKFYVWSHEEIMTLLGSERGARFCTVYDVSPNGNFEGHNILNLIVTPGEPANKVATASNALGLRLEVLQEELDRDRQFLLAHRSKRIRPGLDDKILVAWNAMAVDSLARAGIALGRSDWTDSAKRCAAFLNSELRGSAGQLLHVWRQGRSEIDAFLDDYACLVNAMISLYEVDFDTLWLDQAIELSDQMLDRFADEQGGFYFTSKQAEPLITRAKDWIDHSIPSGNAMAATALLRLFYYTNKSNYRRQAEETLVAGSGLMKRSPGACGQLLIALDWLIGPIQQCVLLQPSVHRVRPKWMDAISRRYLPHWVTVVQYCDDTPMHVCPATAALLEGRSPLDSREPTMYLCEGMKCQTPCVGEQSILDALPVKDRSPSGWKS